MLFDAWVFDNAHVGGFACVYGNARVHGQARVTGRAQVFDRTASASPRIYPWGRAGR